MQRGSDAAERAAALVPRAPRDQSVTNGPVGDQPESPTDRIVAGQSVGPVGLEPTTYGLKVRSSTN